LSTNQRDKPGFPKSEKFGVRAINHGVVVHSARHQQRTRKDGAREQAKRFTDSSVSSGVRP